MSNSAFHISAQDAAELTTFAQHIAKEAGYIAQSYWRTPTLKAGWKEDVSSVVTIADVDIEKTLRSYINERYPDHGFIGEETGTEKSDAPLVWVIDPIDGTLSYIHGKLNFTVLVGLLVGDMPYLGVIHQPILGETWTGSMGGEAFLNKNRIKTSGITAMRDAKVAINGPEYLFVGDIPLEVTKLQRACKTYTYGGDAYNYALLSSGYIDAVYEPTADLCDCVAVTAIVKAAGGAISDLKGQPISRHHKSGMLASSTNELHRELLQLITIG